MSYRVSTEKPQALNSISESPWINLIIDGVGSRDEGRDDSDSSLMASTDEVFVVGGGTAPEDVIFSFVRGEPRLHCVLERDVIQETWTVDKFTQFLYRSVRLVVVMTQASLTKPWIHSQTYSALERCRRGAGSPPTLLVLIGIVPADVEHQLFGVLAGADVLTLDTSRQGGGMGMLQRRVLEWLTAPRRTILTSLDHRWKGLCWQYYLHLQRRLPFEDGLGIVVFIPDPKQHPLDLEDLSPIIKKDKKFSGNVYRIMDTRYHKQALYRFHAEIPWCLLKLLDLADKEPEIALQVSRFYFILSQIVSHKTSPCRHVIVIHIGAEDTKEDIGRLVLDRMPVLSATRFFSNRKLDQVLLIGVQDENDLQMLGDVARCLADYKFSVNKLLLSNSEFNDFQTELDRHKTLRWIVVIISQRSREYMQQHIRNFRFRGPLYRCVHLGNVRVVPIIDGLEETDIPLELHAVTFLDRQDPSYLTTLVSILNDQDVRSGSLLNLVDVHQGLAWNYLLDTEGVEQKLRDLQKCLPFDTVYQKLVILAPLSCSLAEIRSLDRDSTGILQDNRFCRASITVPETSAGVLGMLSELTTERRCPYWLKYDNMDYIVCLEFPEPLHILAQIQNMACVARLSQDQLETEVWRFKHALNDLPLATVVVYDDKRLKLYDVLVQVLDDELDD